MSYATLIFELVRMIKPKLLMETKKLSIRSSSSLNNTSSNIKNKVTCPYMQMRLISPKLIPKLPSQILLLSSSSSSSPS